MSGIEETFGFLLKKRRRELGFSGQTMALLIERSPAYVTKMETGKEIPSPAMVREIVKRLNLSDPKPFIEAAINDKALRYVRRLETAYYRQPAVKKEAQGGEEI